MNNINNIILIDDNKIDCFINQRIISLAAKESINIKIFNSAIEALEYLKNNIQDFKVSLFNTNLILVDINMPKMNGFEFLNEFKMSEEIDKESFEVYFLSSSANDCDIIYAKENEFSSGYIVKPLTKDKLVKAFTSKNEKFKMII